MGQLFVELNGRKIPASQCVLCVESDTIPVTMVAFSPWLAKEWVLLWSRLDAVSFVNEEELERLEFFFPHHHIAAVGENLRKVLEDVVRFRVSRFRNLPPAHRINFGPADPFISKLEIRLLADPAVRRPPSMPS